MISDIIVDVSMGETRVALLEDKELVELHIESPEHHEMIGNIYRGIVESVLPGMQAAFINIGYDKNAFLHVKDIVTNEHDSKKNISELLEVGQEIMVQVVKEAIGTKGPRVTTNVTLPGKYIVLLPHCDYIAVSKRIEDDSKRQQLKKIALEIKPENIGLIIRTEGQNVDADELIHERNFLVRLWEKLRVKESDNVPQMIYQNFDLLCRTVRDLFTLNINKFIINDSEQYTKVLELLEFISPSLKDRVEYFGEEYDVFEYYQIENRISKLLDKKVWLKCGGYLVIDQTEALTAIDVNTGKYVGSSDLEETVLKTNLDAAKEVAKQLRLRDLGGIIIIDFIDMYTAEHWEQVLNTLKHYLMKDKTKTMVAGITQLGLVEMTRKKVREHINAQLKMECPCCSGKGKILMPQTVLRLIEKEIYDIFNQTTAVAVEVSLHPRMSQNTLDIARIEEIFDKKISIKYCEDFNLDEVKIQAIDKI